MLHFVTRGAIEDRRCGRCVEDKTRAVRGAAGRPGRSRSCSMKETAGRSSRRVSELIAGRRRERRHGSLKSRGTTTRARTRGRA